MNDKVAIKVENISKKYCKSLKRSMLYGMKDIGRNFLGMSSHSENLRKDEFWALDDVSFEVKKGETLGIVGPNGSGKTTLLKLLNGIFWPDKGKIAVKGKMGALIQVGAGFHPLLTGRENVYLNAAILGMTKKEVDKKFDSIVEFADIGDFIDTPVKYYSSGMFVRLGFAVAVHCEPDILLVDEVLAVGDINFQSKCFNKMGEMRKKEVTTILVSHSMIHITGFCNKVLYLNGGQTRYIGEAKRVIDSYKRDMRWKGALSHFSFEADDVKGTGLVRFTKIEFLDQNRHPITEINAGIFLTLRIHYVTHQYIGHVDLDIAIRDDRGEIFFRASSKAYKKKLIMYKGTGYVDVCFKGLHANNQNLLFYVTLWREDRSELFDWKRELPLYVAGNPLSGGKVLLDVDWTIKQEEECL